MLCEPIDFEQGQLVCTHVGREFRINAESWMPNLKDSRDGGGACMSIWSLGGET